MSTDDYHAGAMSWIWEKPVKVVAIGPEVAQYIGQGGVATPRRKKAPK